MSGFVSGQSVRLVNVVPRGISKNQVVVSDNDEDTDCCKICAKSFASLLALRNHALVEHFNAYSTGDPTSWMEPLLIKEETPKTEAILSSMTPGSLTLLASEDVNCIIIKTEDDCEPPTNEEKQLELVKVNKPIEEDTLLASEDVNCIIIKTEEDCEPPTNEEKQLELVKVSKPIEEDGKTQKEVQPVTGPFQCIQDGCCQRIFSTCCEYSTHYRDEHTRRRKGVRCQVCEKPLSSDVDEQHPYACKDEVSDGSSSEEIDAEALSDSSQGMNANKHNGLVEASIELHDGNNKWSLVVDAADANASNWCEQNLAAPQHQGQIDHRTIKTIPRFTELRVYGGEYTHLSDFNLKHYNSPSGYEQKFGATVQKKRKLSTDTGNGVNQTSQATEERKTIYEDIEETSLYTNQKTVFTKTNNSNEDSTISNANMGYDQNKQEKIIIQKHIKNYICDVCKINFNCKNILESHMGSHYTVLRRKHNTQSSNIKIKHKKKYGNIVKNNEQILKGQVCHFCSKSFVHKGDFTRHIRTHTGDKLYQGNVCNKSFSDKSALPALMRTHTSEKPYQCDVCNKYFAQKYYLTPHLRTHTGEKPFQCKVCNKYFSQKTTLTIHIRTHTGEKPYQCNVCSKYFSRKTLLSSHVRTHTGEKPYQCNVCNMYFSHKSCLTRHLRTHTGEKQNRCNICDKYFSLKSNLTKHIRTHTGEKPYQCNVCNKYFSLKSNLTKHIRIHTGEKSYHCKYCNIHYAHKNSLNFHIRKHHKNLLT